MIVYRLDEFKVAFKWESVPQNRDSLKYNKTLFLLLEHEGNYIDLSSRNWQGVPSILSDGQSLTISCDILNSDEMLY